MDFGNVGLISIIFAAVLIILLIILIVISVIVLKKDSEPEKNQPERRRYDRDDDEDDDDDDDEYDKKEQIETPDNDLDEDTYEDDEEVEAEETEEYEDSAFSDSAFTDSAFVDSAFTESVEAETATSKQDESDKQDERDKSEDSTSETETAASEQDGDDAPSGTTIEIPEIPDEKINDKAETPLQGTEDEQDTDDSKTSAEAEDHEYEDSAFVDSAFGPNAVLADEEAIRPLPVTSPTIPVNPVNTVNINTVNAVDKVNTTNPEAGITDMDQMEDFLAENPVPKKEKKKKKLKKHEVEFEEKFGTFEPEFNGGDYFWYNNQDIAECRRKEDMYFYCHYFDEADECIIPLITEMYDCAFVRTEEIQFIAYGIEFKSMGFREIMNANTNIGLDKSRAIHQPTEKDLELIYQKWCGYVDKFLEIIVINASSDVKEYIKSKLYEYGHSDVDKLLYSPE